MGSDENVVRGRFGPQSGSTSKAQWSRALAKPGSFSFCASANRHLTQSERSIIRVFCDQNFGNARWEIAAEESFIAFMILSDCEKFMGTFG